MNTIRPRRVAASVSALVELARLTDGNLHTAVARFGCLVGSLYQRIALSVRSHLNGCGVETYLDKYSEYGSRAGHAQVEVGLRCSHGVGMTNDQHLRDGALLDGLQDLRK